MVDSDHRAWLYWHTHETNAAAMKPYDQVARKAGFVVYRKDFSAATRHDRGTRDAGGRVEPACRVNINAAQPAEAT